MKYLTSPAGQPFQFAWREAVDSLAWLSGILIIAIQAAIKSWTAVEGEALSYGCIGGAVICFLLLLSAMNERGQNAAWQPPLSMKCFSFFLVCGLLAAASRAQIASASKGAEVVAAVESSASPAAKKNGATK